ncbi:epimerase [Hydrogenophaga crassostreae]|uniref:Epimerase n=1 Tax=Hydrogenophaga crassostreae TaxID=1763535 RepID=A0A162SR00_9BURK|nr:NAD(P)H-binding protein [Hydrogenophaga crassostreae]AOW14786.1 epimerase [Hydrogenophaga crassostreae]OAD39614.1 epimerase [Hydrogenophaga crassostreae]
MNNHQTALVLGATGGIGGAIAAALLRHGWQIRGLARDAAQARRTAPQQLAGIQWIAGNAMQRDAVVRAADGAAVIVHAVNPPGYRDWDKCVLPMMANTIAAARAAGGARVVLPGTIYNFNPSTSAVVDGDTAQLPRSRKGMVRVAMERQLLGAAPEVPSLILRAGDFFGPGARSSWFAQAMVKPGRPLRRIVNPARGSGHSWAYLPDLAEAFARLLDAPQRLRVIECLQFEGLVDTHGHALIDALNRSAGRTLPVFRFPWWLMQALAPFGGFPREAADIASSWQNPMRLDNRRLEELIGPEPRTALDEAVHQTLVNLGCVPQCQERAPLVTAMMR